MSKRILLETTRQELINTSKSGQNYNNKKINRWNEKSKITIANTVADYNQIDMNEFWKHDNLKFIVKVRGETNNYQVTMEFNNLQKKIQHYISIDKNKFNRDNVTKALMDALSSSHVKVNCTCPDFKYRLAYYASKNGFKSGEQENRPAEITNPLNDKGSCCKHILAVINNAMWIRNVASVIVNYANYAKEHMEYNYSRYIFPNIYSMPYNQAVQMCMDDFDADGDPIDDMDTSEELINMANEIAKSRFRGHKTKVQIQQEKERKAEEEKAKQDQLNQQNQTNNQQTNNNEENKNSDEQESKS